VKRRFLQSAVAFSLFLSLSFLSSKPALGYVFLAPNAPAINPQPDSAELKTAIALLVQEKYTDAILKRLIQAHPTHMATRDYYSASQTL
jgi:hypothetical protein